MNFQETIARFEQIADVKLERTTIGSYKPWIRKYLHFLRTDEARKIEVSERKFEVFLGRMAREDYSRVSQDQAFSAVLWLYKHVLCEPLREVNALRCKSQPKERYVPTREEITAMFRELHDTAQYRIRLAVALMYGCGLRVSEICRARIKDVDFERLSLTVQDSKGTKSRQVRLPEILLPALQKHVERAESLAEIDIRERQPVQLPGRLAVKYPRWQFQVRWHFLFPSAKPCPHPRTKILVRWCMGTDVIQRAVRDAAERAGVEGKVTPHCLRHSYCTHLLDDGLSMRRVQEAMGHTDIRTTAGYATKECLEMRSPLDKIVQFPRSA